MGNIQMFLKRIVLPALVGMLMIGATSAVYAQAAKMAQSMTQYKSAAQELVALHNGTKGPKSAKAMTKKIAGATKRKDQAAAAIQAAMQKLDAKSEKAGRLAEKLFAEMQKHNKAVADAHLASIKRVTSANAAMRAKSMKK